MNAKLTMTLNLRPDEMAFVDQTAADHDMPKTAVIRQALRLYQLVNARLAAGETMTFSGDRERQMLFVGVGFTQPPSTGDAG